MFKRTTAINKILALTARKKVIQGGTSAGKTYGILPILINDAILNDNSEISVVSESIPHLRRGAMKDFIKILQQTGRFNDANWNRSLLTYTFPNGSYIEFFSADQEGRLRGARRKKLYINEANNISFESYHQLAIRTSHDIYLDFNPTAEFWAHTEVLTEPDSELLILTYLDNEALPPNVVGDLMNAKAKAEHSEYWANWWKVYGLGQVGSLQGVVFNNWKLCDLTDEAKLEGIGLDFGYSNDPTAAVAVYRLNNKLIFDQLIYQKGLLNSEIADLLKKHHTTIYADSAEPKSIEELSIRGLHIRPALKGKDSILFGISLLQQNDFLVTNRSTELIRELRAYSWDKDKTGATLNKPIDAFNHCIDAMRYWAVMCLHKPSGVYNII